MTEQELAIDAIRRLNQTGLPYLLTGSMASNYWGIPRTTHDLDFIVQLSRESIPNLVREFRDDFYLDEPAVRAALATAYQFNAIDKRSALKIECAFGGHHKAEEHIIRRVNRLQFYEQPDRKFLSGLFPMVTHIAAWERGPLEFHEE